MYSPVLLSKDTVDSRQIEKLIDQYIDLVKYAPDMTQELLIIFDKVNWISLYWNPVSQDWRICLHNVGGWETPSNSTTSELSILVSACKVGTRQIFALQYRTSAGIRTYKNTK